MAGCAATGPACPIGAAVGGTIGKLLTIVGIGLVLSSDSSNEASDPLRDIKKGKKPNGKTEVKIRYPEKKSNE